MFNYILYRIGQFIALYLPLNLSYKIAGFCSDLHYMISRRDREIVKENLKVIFPKKNIKEIKGLARQTFRNFAKYLIDFFRFSKLDKEYIKKMVKLENMHYFDEALSKGKGVIILTAHIGNWELGAVVIALLGYPFYAVALPHKYKKVDDFFNFQRERKGAKVISLRKAARGGLTVLKENKMLALAGDRDFAKGGVVVDFFGRPSNFPVGPAFFSLKTGANIIPTFMVRNKNETFTLQIGKPINAVFNSTDKNEYIKKVTSQCKVIIEEQIRRYPDQWYMFMPFWIKQEK